MKTCTKWNKYGKSCVCRGVFLKFAPTMRIGLCMIVLGWLFTATAAHAQTLSPFGPDAPPEDITPLRKANRPIDKVFFGGNFGLQIGSVTYVNLASHRGLQSNGPYRVGAASTTSIPIISANRTTSSAGACSNSFVVERHPAPRRVRVHGLPHGLRFSPTGKEIHNIGNAFNVGAGYARNFGRRAFTNIIVLYNVIHDRNNTIYNTPWSLRGYRRILGIGSWYWVIRCVLAETKCVLIPTTNTNYPKEEIPFNSEVSPHFWSSSRNVALNTGCTQSGSISAAGSG